MGEVVVLGEPKIVQLRFSDIKDEDIKTGQWVIIYNEVPARKIGKELFEVYIDAEPFQVKTLEEEMRERMEKLSMTLHQVDYLEENILKYDDTPKYIKKGHGSKRLRPWESPRYFG